MRRSERHPITSLDSRGSSSPAARGTGLGRTLAETVIAHARGIGYRELRLDTADWMRDALRLYAKLGFRECSPYYHNPMPGAVYMSLVL